MTDEPEAPPTRGVTVELLGTVDLAGEIEGMAGRQLRMRMVTIEAGRCSAQCTTTSADPASFARAGSCGAWHCTSASVGPIHEWLSRLVVGRYAR